MNVVVFRSEEENARAAARLIIERGIEAVRERGIFHIALSGGSTPVRIYKALLADPIFAALVPKTHLWWGDDRAVGHEHNDSNVKLAVEHLIAPAHFPYVNVHPPLSGNADLEAEAMRYEAQLRKYLPADANGLPIIDVQLLGMGDDGHTASLFPGTKALAERERLFVANEVPQLKTRRLTMTLPMLNASRQILVAITGAKKAARLGEIMGTENTGGTPDPATDYPVELVVGNGSNVTWFLDEAAAAEIDIPRS